MKNINSQNIVFILLISILFSCTSISKITILNDSNQNEWNVSPIPPKHSLEIGDVLIVKVLSFDEETTNFFNVENNVNSVNSSLTSANIYLNGFTINQEGMIEIPYIGEVYVLNQTINQAKESIEEKVNEYLKDATVICKLGNFNITVLGEIYRPNTYPIYKDNISIFEAVAISGGITDYGDLTKVKLIRTHNNKKTVHKIDLTQQSVINSDFYYLRNNDLLYVEPLRYRGLRKSQSQLLLSSLTTVAVLVNVYLKITE
jgi:polysaccharide biosynthesis/export protein